MNLRAGDVLGGSVSGSGTSSIVNDPAGREVHGSHAGCLRHLPGRLAAAGRRQRGGGPRRRAQRAPLPHRDRWRGSLRRHARGLPARAAEGGRRPDALPRLRRPAREHGHLRRSGRPGALAAVGLPRSLGHPGVAVRRAAGPHRRHGQGEREARLRGAGNARARAQQPRRRRPVRAAQRQPADRRRDGRAVGHRHDRDRAVDRPGELRDRGDGADPAGLRVGPGRRRRVVQRLHQAARATS